MYSVNFPGPAATPRGSDGARHLGARLGRRLGQRRGDQRGGDRRLLDGLIIYIYIYK